MRNPSKDGIVECTGTDNALRLPVNMRARRQKSGRVLFYYDAGGRPRREVPLGDDYSMAMRRYQYLVNGAAGYELAPPAHCLYRHFDHGGLLLYVGVSFNAVIRLEQHRKGAPWYFNISRIEVERFPDREACKAAERLAIAREMPLFNFQHAKPERRIRRSSMLAAGSGS